MLSETPELVPRPEDFTFSAPFSVDAVTAEGPIAPPPRMDVGDAIPLRLVEARKARGMRAADVAARSKTQLRQYCDFEGGRQLPSAKTLVRLADALEIDLNYLCGRAAWSSKDGGLSQPLVVPRRRFKWTEMSQAMAAGRPDVFCGPNATFEQMRAETAIQKAWDAVNMETPEPVYAPVVEREGQRP